MKNAAKFQNRGNRLKLRPPSVYDASEDALGRAGGVAKSIAQFSAYALVTGILGSLFLAECGLIAAGRGGQTMRTPFDAEAGSCYNDVKQAPILGPGLEQMLAAARRKDTFEARLRSVQDLRLHLVKNYGELPFRPESMSEGNSFACAANDLLEALFTAEVETLRSLAIVERTKRSNLLLRQVQGIELDPQWNDHIRPRILHRIQQTSQAH
jgi:hypothetical protein